MKKFDGFKVHGKPFFALGAQAHNSSSYSREMFQGAVDSALALRCNTLEAPVYWEKIEPQEGEFDFSMIDMMVDLCRKNALHLVILWFGSWKNGEMSYCPAYVKRDTVRFQRVLGADGVAVTDLSAHSAANRDQDANAFAKLLAYLKKIDGDTQTVIAVQVENEPGYLRTDRDYSPSALDHQNRAVPEGLLAFLEGRKSSEPYRDWVKNGFQRGQNWFQTFGIRGYEYCEAWYISRYIDWVAAKGKAQYDIPMYVNVWLTTAPWGIPGLNYPGAGAVKRNLDIWQCAVSALDIIAPDIYVRNPYRFQEHCNTYLREDNALFIPESFRDVSSACNMFYAIAVGAVGYACFGSELVFDKDGQISEECKAIVDSNSVVQNAMPLILKHRNTGKIHSVVRHEGDEYAMFEFDSYIGSVQYEPIAYNAVMDYHNIRDLGTKEMQTPRGLIFEDEPNVFYLAGCYHLRLAKKKSPDWNLTDRYLNIVDHISVEEGHFDDNGVFVSDRVRNGDELIFGGFWVTPKCGIVRVQLL